MLVDISSNIVDIKGDNKYEVTIDFYTLPETSDIIYSMYIVEDLIRVDDNSDRFYRFNYDNIQDDFIGQLMETISDGLLYVVTRLNLFLFIQIVYISFGENKIDLLYMKETLFTELSKTPWDVFVESKFRSIEEDEILFEKLDRELYLDEESSSEFFTSTEE